MWSLESLKNSPLPATSSRFISNRPKNDSHAARHVDFSPWKIKDAVKRARRVGRLARRRANDQLLPRLAQIKACARPITSAIHPAPRETRRVPEASPATGTREGHRSSTTYMYTVARSAESLRRCIFHSPYPSVFSARMRGGDRDKQIWAGWSAEIGDTADVAFI